MFKKSVIILDLNLVDRRDELLEFGLVAEFIAILGKNFALFHQILILN